MQTWEGQPKSSLGRAAYELTLLPVSPVSRVFAAELFAGRPLPLPHVQPLPASFCSGVVRQLGRPNLLAATYSSNAAAAATAAMEELEETLLGSLQELQRIGSGVGELRCARRTVLPMPLWAVGVHTQSLPGLVLWALVHAS